MQIANIWKTLPDCDSIILFLTSQNDRITFEAKAKKLSLIIESNEYAYMMYTIPHTNIYKNILSNFFSKKMFCISTRFYLSLVVLLKFA